MERVRDFVKEYGERGLRGYLERVSPLSAEEFIHRLYEDLDEAIDQIERAAHQLQGEGENKLRTRVLHHLRSKGYDARAESDERGHSDILVEQRSLRLVWLAEAKIHGEYDWLAKGLAQLHTRYATGRHPDMALLVFSFNLDTQAVVTEWQRRLEAAGYCGLVAGSCAPVGAAPLRFASRHVHAGSGLELQTRHLFASLYFKPEDT
ncbi:MAG: hypothetical protein H6741_17970 [Alphaproteobacteria bacterium]|nr:hypothetical protein [Alphaproteobacteria bacterium]